MKRLVFVTILSVILSLVFVTSTNAASTEVDRYVGLHDKLLSFDKSEVTIYDEKMVVPLKKISDYLYAEIVEDEIIIQVRKNGFEIAYDYTTGKTYKDSIEVDWNPIIEIEGTLFVSVRYIAEEFGFKVEYISSIRTARIYRDDYKHMDHPDYEAYVKTKLLNIKENEISPTSPNQPPEKPKKANVYLTFDDGPNKFTTLNNEILKKYNVKASFFFLGQSMKYNETIVKAVDADGHYIGSHSMSHDKNKVYKSPEAFINEMSGGVELIRQMTGNDTRLIRVPYGSKPHITPAMQSEMNKKGYKMWDWDVDSKDWKYTDNQFDEIVKNVCLGVEKAYKSGDQDIVILLHDRSQTVKALPQIIEWLQKEGYTIKKYEPTYHFVQNFLRDGSL